MCHIQDRAKQVPTVPIKAFQYTRVLLICRLWWHSPAGVPVLFRPLTTNRPRPGGDGSHSDTAGISNPSSLWQRCLISFQGKLLREKKKKKKQASRERFKETAPGSEGDTGEFPWSHVCQQHLCNCSQSQEAVDCMFNINPPPTPRHTPRTHLNKTLRA